MEKLTKKEIEKFNLNVNSRKLRGSALIEYKKQLRLTSEQKEIIIGTLLGDSSMRNSKCNFSLKFEQKYTQIEYLQHLYEIFKPFVGTGPKMRLIHNTFHKDYGVSCWFRTYAHLCLKYYENMFYKKDSKNSRKKVVPKNIHKLLTPRALAYWFMDDGTSSPDSNGILKYCINTQGFTSGEQKILVSALKRNFDLNATIGKDRTYYRLYIQRQSNNDFKKCISPYILPSFKYKLEEKELNTEI